MHYIENIVIYRKMKASSSTVRYFITAPSVMEFLIKIVKGF